MPDELAVILRHHEQLGHVSEWLFAGGEDYPPHQNTVGHQWRLTQKRAGLSGIRLHDLRHFYDSGLVSEGCDVVTVQRALGHAKASTTLDTYATLWPSGEDRARRAASSFAREVLGDLRAEYGQRAIWPTRNSLCPGTMRNRYTLKRNSTTSPSAMT
jgi:integrase